MKKAIAFLILSTCLLISAVSGCKTPTFEPGGAYAPTNTAGVVSVKAGLFLFDSSHKLAYDSIQTVFKFEKDNRAELWAISHNIKKGLDKARLEVNALELRLAQARRAYVANPTPEGLTGLNKILAELQRIVPIVQQQLTTK